MKYTIKMPTEDVLNNKKLLVRLGYESVEYDKETDVYTASSLGVILPSIHIEGNSPYGNILAEERQNMGMSKEAMANILLMHPKEYEAVEEGKMYLSSSRLQMVSNIFFLSRTALEKGKREEIDENIGNKMNALIEEIKSLEENINLLKGNIENINNYVPTVGTIRIGG